ncbi:GntR family transcriptional regulator [Streptomyces sp. NBC_00564]|uniref:GntR family transcriptional regulator n=1 Tax=Streptomyces sp. NBC_00564 TaxID=2903663 RepID=UPI00352CDD6F|nr:GntR family transcriptional regulator [Streptomyces sp. NBC_00564]
MTESAAGAPKYQRVASALRRAIQEGTYGPGQKLPTEDRLATEYRMSVPTIRQGLSVLVAEGLIDRQHGKGTFVKDEHPNTRRSRNRYGRARHDAKLLTRDLQHSITFAGRAPVPTHIAKVMGIEPGTEVIIRRRLLRDRETGRPEELGASYIPVEVAGGTYVEEPQVVPKALFLCIEEISGKRYVQAQDLWRARVPTGDEATALEMPAGMPVMHVVHTARADDDQILEVSESVWPADRIVIVDEYAIEQEANEPDAPSTV